MVRLARRAPETSDASVEYISCSVEYISRRRCWRCSSARTSGRAARRGVDGLGRRALRGRRARFATAFADARTAAAGRDFEFVRLIETGDEVIVTYEMTRCDGGRGRNTEILTFDDDVALRSTSAGTSSPKLRVNSGC